ncbi:MAG TPA: shikimate dehydrogenase [Ignavibacteriales bacterium]|nr:shikimate dehydrogenase [Ignavibacteriales bacterium]HPD67605.1 shikimate dehydrogenase [Ignavibacteriales bacterium]HRR19144.1 shikimate dehydrogenase [Ignavibacteriales bacterium]HRT99370.1 shikimate dehydrogenase [Ignavibacteriales bacterium]
MISERISLDTKLLAVIGYPISHSLSPLIHNKAINLINENAIYLMFDIHPSNLEKSLKSFLTLGFTGINVTIPHKEAIIPHLNHVSEEAAIIGAVNTVTIQDGKLFGYNTDVYGIIKSLDNYKEEIKDQEVTVVGAGGASRCVIYTLIRYFNTKKINIINRNDAKAEFLKDYFVKKMNFHNIESFPLAPPDIVELLSNSKLIINTTPIGMYPNVDDSFTAIEESFNENQIVFDVIYNPFETKLLKIAASKGARTVGGMDMFIEQAAKSYELWLNKEFPRDIIKEFLIAKLENQNESK